MKRDIDKPEPTAQTQRQALRLARGLGWLSVGLGLAELLAPRAVARGAAVSTAPTLLRGYGLREIVTGAGLLTARDPAPWLLARVAGDALDLATVVRRPDPLAARHRVALTLATLAVVAVADAAATIAARRADLRRRRPQVDYSDRSGFPDDPSTMRGRAARGVADERVGATATAESNPFDVPTRPLSGDGADAQPQAEGSSASTSESR
jgi:hypothetical protein